MDTSWSHWHSSNSLWKEGWVQSRIDHSGGSCDSMLSFLWWLLGSSGSYTVNTHAFPLWSENRPSTTAVTPVLKTVLHWPQQMYGKESSHNQCKLEELGFHSTLVRDLCTRERAASLPLHKTVLKLDQNKSISGFSRGTERIVRVNL